MKNHFSIFIALLLLFSCKIEDFTPSDFPSKINFEVSDWVLKDKDVTCVDFDRDENVWIASGSELIFYDGNRFKTYEAGSAIVDLVVAPNGNVWLGTKEIGLARFSNGKFKFYTEENAGLPRNYIHSIEVTSDGNVWFCSANRDIGGLMSFDGNKFQLYSPDNSDINQRVVGNLKADNSNNLYFTSLGTVGMTTVYKVDGQNNSIENVGGAFYWIVALDLTSNSEVVVATDHSLSSCYGCYTNGVVIYRNNSWEVLNPDFEMNYFNKMFVDKRDYIWSQGGSGVYSVYDGKNWQHSTEGQIPEAFIKSVKVDKHNNIWFCTNEGIFILNQ